MRDGRGVGNRSEQDRTGQVKIGGEDRKGK
jgi:hypothetical protein